MIFTRLELDPISIILRTRYKRFTSAQGIEGLLRENGRGLIELLAVVATHPGTGQFHRFISALKIHYQTICAWHIDNPFLPAVLARYGFQPELMVEGEFGEVLSGMRWDRPPSPPVSPSTPAGTCIRPSED